MSRHAARRTVSEVAFRLALLWSTKDGCWIVALAAIYQSTVFAGWVLTLFASEEMASVANTLNFFGRVSDMKK